MTNSETEQDVTEKASASDPGNRSVLWIIFLMVIALMTASAYFTYDKLKSLTDDQQAGIDELNNKLNIVDRTLTEIRREQKGLANSLTELSRQQLNMEDKISMLYQREDGKEPDWPLAEAEYLLIIASHRLMLEGDIKTGLAAMQAADNRLKGLTNPGLLTVRKQLANDMNDLRAVPPVDIAGLVLYLGDLVQRAGTLPLRTIEPIPGQEITPDVDVSALPWWQQIFKSMWAELKEVIIVTRDGQEVELSLLPQQEFFLRQNLKLQLEGARYAVLRQDTDSFQTSIEQISGWLNEYFNRKDYNVANALESLEQMAELRLRPEIPDHNSSLETLRAYIKDAMREQNKTVEKIPQ